MDKSNLFKRWQIIDTGLNGLAPVQVYTELLIVNSSKNQSYLTRHTIIEAINSIN